MGWYKNLKIGKKLFLSFLMLALFLFIVGYLGIGNAGKIQGNMKEAAAVRLPAVDFLIQTDRDLQQLLVAERSMIFSNTNSEVFQSLVKDYDENLAQSKERWEKYKVLADTKEEKDLIPKFEKARAEWEAVSKQIVDGRKADTREGRRLAIDLSLGEAAEKFETMRDFLDKLQEINQEISKRSYQESVTTYRSVFISILVITVIAIFMSVFIWLLLNKTVTQPVRDLVDMSRDLAEGEGDLTKRIHTENKDELGELSGFFNQFIEQIQEIVSRVKKSTLRLIDSTEKISDGYGALATRTSEQAASITQTSTTLEEFSAILKAGSENSAEASKLLDSFNADVQAKKGLIDNVISTMSEIEDSSKRIDDIVNVINDISFQTNLLALNAAVEAARAGEAGRGFAVVASEVRNLAQKTAESSKNIQDIVSRNVESTTRGTQLVNETSKFFASIASVVVDISGKVQEISNSSREQFTGVEQINEAISQLESVINQNAAMVDDFADNSNVLMSNTSELMDLVARFKVESSAGPKDGAAPAAPAAKQGDDFFGSGEEAFEEF